MGDRTERFPVECETWPPLWLLQSSPQQRAAPPLLPVILERNLLPTSLSVFVFLSVIPEGNLLSMYAACSPQIPPLHLAAVEMTNLSLRFGWKK